jgi:hypothetical protein
MIPENEVGTDFQDLVLKLLFDFRMSPFNRTNLAMPLSTLAKSARAEPKEVEAIADSLVEQKPQLVEKVRSPYEPAFRITGQGVVFVQNAAQGLLSVS